MLQQRLTPFLLLSLSFASPINQAKATQLDFSTSVQSSPNRITLKAGLSEFPVAAGQGSVSLSNQALQLGYSRSLSLPLGTLNSQTELTRPWSGGLRLSSRSSGSLGPVALNIGGEAFNAPLTDASPFDIWSEEARDLRTQGWNLNLDGRYRLSRNLIAQAGGELGPQPNGFIGIETRREVGQQNSEDEVSSNATLTLRGGARAGAGVLGLTTGATYAREDGLTLRADVLLGAEPGISGSLSVPTFNETELSLYGVYEPWRVNSAPLRYGAELSRPLGEGTVSLALRGGHLHSGEQGGGVQLRYTLPLPTASRDEP